MLYDVITKWKKLVLIKAAFTVTTHPKDDNVRGSMSEDTAVGDKRSLMTQ